MPSYEYRCRNGHTFEAFHSMSDDPVSKCEECGAPVERVFHPIAVHFKGSGFYTTDYAKKGGKGASADGDGSSGSDSGSDSSSKSDSGSKSDSSSESGSSSKKSEKSKSSSSD